MKTLFKFLLGAFVVVCLGIGAALFVLQRMFPPEKIQALVLEKLQAALHRQIRLSRADLGLRGLSLQGLEVSEEPDFNAGTLLRAQTIRVLPRLSALLQRRLELADVLLSDWECNVTHRADGTWNVESAPTPSQTPSNNQTALAGTASAGKPYSAPPSLREDRVSVTKSSGPAALGASPAPGAAGALATAWNVDRVRLANGTVRYTDNATHAAYTFKNIQISTKHLKPEGTFPADLSMDYSGQGLEGRIELRGAVDLGGLDPARMIAQWDSLKLRHLGLALESSGQIKDFSAPELSFKASLPKQHLDAESASHWPQWLLPMIPIQGEVNLHKTGDRIDLHQVNIIWNSLRAEIQGQVQLQDKGFPVVHLRVKTGNFSLADMAAFLPPAHRVRPQGQGNIELRVDGPANAPALSGDASLKDMAVSYESQSLSGLRASAKFSPQSIIVETQGIWNRGNFQISLVARNYRTLPEIKFNGQLSELDLESLTKMSSSSGVANASPGESSGALTPTAKAISDQPSEPNNFATDNQSSRSEGGAPTKASSSTSIHASGQLAIGKITHPNFTASNSTFTWDLQNANIQSRITGSAKFKVGTGHFDDLKNVAGENGLVKALLLPITILQKIGDVAHIPLLPSFDKVNFKTITGDYVFQNGVMTIRESHLDSDAAFVTATGKADLVKETLDMHLSTQLLVQGLSGPIGFKVSGTFSNPSVKPDVASILQQPAVNQVIQQGTKLLQNLFR